MENISGKLLVMTSLLAATDCPAASQLFWGEKNLSTSGAVIKTSNVDGSAPQAIYNPGGLHTFYDLETDPSAGKVYWSDSADPSAGTLKSSNFDGSGVASVGFGLGQASGFALDFINQKLIAGKPGAMVSGNMADGSAGQNLFSLTGGARDVEYDMVTGKVYWIPSGIGESEGFILRANLDGSDREVIVSMASGVGGNFFCLDVGNQYIYWSNDVTYGTDAIMRCSINGGGAQIIVNNTLNPQGLAIDNSSGRIYWAEMGSIKKANLDGSDTETIYIGVNSSIYGLALAATPIPEPAELGLFLGMLSLGVGLQRRRRSRSSG